MTKSGLTKEELISWGGSEVFNQAFALCNSGDVHDVKYDDESLTVSGKIDQPDGWSMPVSFTLKAGGRIDSHCPCYTNQKLGKVCPHVVAIGIAQWVEEMEEEEIARPAKTDDTQTPDEDNTKWIEVPIAPEFRATIRGSRASLSIELDAIYGQRIDIPACSVQSERTVYLEDPDDDLVRRTRSIKAEKDAVATLGKWGFSPGYGNDDLRLYVVDPQKVLNFLGCGIPELRRRGWLIDLDGPLANLYDSFKSIIPVVKIKDVANGDFDVSYAFESQDGEQVSAVEIQAALNRHDGCLLKNNKVYLFDNEAVERMHDVFRDCAASQGGAPAGWFRVKGIYAPYVKSSLDQLLDAVDLDDSNASNWREIATLRNDRDPNAKFEPFALGKLECILRPYQKQGVYWMRFLENAGLCGLLADEMGLGKTLQTLTWLSLPRPTKRPAMIICPTSLVMNWAAEAKKFTPWLKTLVISGANRASNFADIDSADIVITSYALIQRDFESAYFGVEFSTIVLDEAQHIKNRETKNAKAVKLLKADRRLVLTGTPIENSVADVWSIFDFLMPGYLGDYQTFKVNFEDPIRNDGDETALARLKRKLHPFIMRRLKKSVAKDLPDKIVKVSYCPMSEEDQHEYSLALSKTRTQAGDMLKAKGFAKSKFELLAMLMKLRQIASRAKVEPFMEQLASAIESGHKILVFSQFVSMLKTLAERMENSGIPFCYLDGSTKDRLGECDRFNRTPEIPVFLISLMAGGTGLNLTGADMVIHYDPWWNPAVEDQATDRAHRIGQKKKVYVMKMIASGSIEEKVLELQRRKQAIIAATVSTTDAAVMESLTVQDLNELLN